MDLDRLAAARYLGRKATAHDTPTVMFNVPGSRRFVTMEETELGYVDLAIQLAPIDRMSRRYRLSLKSWNELAMAERN